MLIEEPQLLDEHLRQLLVLDEVYAEALSSRVLKGCADVVRGRAVEDEEAVVERPGAADGELRVLRVEHVDVALREPVAGGVDGHRDALALLREDVQGVDVCVAVYEGDFAFGATHEIRQQAEGVEHLPGEEDPLGFLDLAFEQAEYLVEALVGRLLKRCLIRFDITQPLKQSGILGEEVTHGDERPHDADTGLHRHFAA